MKTGRPRLLIIDQNLRDFVGHYHDYTQVVIAAARAQDVDVELIASTDFAAAELAGARIVGRIAPGGLLSGGWRASARAMVAKSPGRVRRAAASLSRRLHRDAAADPRLGAEIVRAIANANLSASDHVLIHTLEAAEFLGLAATLACDAGLAPRLHLVMRYDGAATFREAFGMIARAPTRTILWTDTAELARHYLTLGCRRMGVLPIPHGLTSARFSDAPRRRPLTFGALGGARGDKGFDLLPGIIADLRPRMTRGELRFLIQTNFGFSREEGRMARASAALRRDRGVGVDLIEDALDTPAFAGALAACDALLLPYDPHVYARRSSGLLVQAMAAGIPAFVPADTWLASEVARGGGVIVARGQSFAAAIEAALPDFEMLRATAAEAAPAARERHDAGRLVAALLESDASDSAHLRA